MIKIQNLPQPESPQLKINQNQRAQTNARRKGKKMTQDRAFKTPKLTQKRHETITV